MATEPVVPADEVAERVPLSAVLLAVLADHIGRANGILGATLADLVVVNPRKLREVIQELREQGHHVCGTPESGYFLAETPDELEETCQFLQGRALASLRQVAAMRRVSLPDLFGQIHLPT
jgi:biotin operon repressor